MADEKPPPKAQSTPPIPPAPLIPPRMMTEGETKKAYDAFKVYFEMGDARHIPEMLKSGNCAINSLYVWARRFRWDQRCDLANNEAVQRFNRATKRIAAVNARQRGEVAANNHKIAIALQGKTLEVAKAIQPAEQESRTVSADGKTTHIVLRPPPNIRLTDAARLAVAANVLMKQADQLVNSDLRGGDKGDGGPHGVPTPDSLADPLAIPPNVVVFLDGGDGLPMQLSALPPPDELDPHSNPFDGSSKTPSEIPSAPREKAKTSV